MQTAAFFQILTLFLFAPVAVMATSSCSDETGSRSQKASATPWGGAGSFSDTVEKGEIIQRITAPGVISAKRSSMISSPYAGYVRKIHVQVGEKVSAGAPLVSVSQSATTPESEVYPLRSPFSGSVVQILRTEGEYVEMGSTNGSLVRVDDISARLVEASIPELDYPKLKLNQEVRIRVAALPGKLYRGIIRRISLAARIKQDFLRGSVEFPVKIEVLDGDESLKPGMSATIDVIVDKREQVLRVHNLFLKRNGEQYRVLLKNGEWNAVRVGLQNDEFSEVLEGLKEGDKMELPRGFTSQSMPMGQGGGGRSAPGGYSAGGSSGGARHP